MKTTLLLMLSILAARAADPAAGHYYLEGVREVGSELLLKPDGTFEYMLAYGAADYTASGTWKSENGTVVLNSGVKKAPPFRLIGAVVTKSPGIRVWIKAPNGRGIPNIDVALKTTTGELTARTDSEGAALFPKSGAPQEATMRI